MRLIDADELERDLESLKQDYEDEGCDSKRIDGIDDCIEEIRCTESVDAVPVVHAHWIPEYPNKRTGKAYSHKCSECKKTVYNNRQVSVDELGYTFCPNCGAKMEGNHETD